MDEFESKYQKDTDALKKEIGAHLETIVQLRLDIGWYRSIISNLSRRYES